MSKVFTPVVDADAVYGDGDWRPLLGAGIRKEWKLHMIGKQSIDARLRGITYPAFDWTLSMDDKAFGTSFSPCWSSTPDKRLGRHFTPNAFALPLLIYPYMGEKKEHWFSPGNLRNMIGGEDLSQDDTADAFDDLNRWIRRNKNFSQAQKDAFVKAPSMRDDALVPSRSLRYFSLNRCFDKETQWHDAVVAYTASAYSYLIEQMRWAHQAQDGPPRDPDFPQYMLGDPTHPDSAIEWHVDKVLLDDKDTTETNVMCFTERQEFLDENQRTHKFRDEDLERRFLLPDPKNWNIPTYEEQVEYMLNHYDPSVTIDMIKAACAYRFNGEIPSSRPGHIVASVSTSAASSSASAPEERRSSSRRSSEPEADPVAAVTGGGRARMTPPSDPPVPQRRSSPPRGAEAEASAPAPANTATTAAANAVTYWAGRPSQKPSKLTVEEMQALYDAGDSENVKVMLAPNQWVLLEDSGLIQKRAAPADEEVPMIPDDDEPPMIPDDTPVVDAGPAKEGQITRAQMKERLFPDGTFDALSAANKQVAETLIDRAWEGTDHGANAEMPDDVVDGLLQLVG